MNEDTGRIPDILEHGAPVEGQPQTSEERLYMQLNVFTLAKTQCRAPGHEVYLKVSSPRFKDQAWIPRSTWMSTIPRGSACCSSRKIPIPS